MIDYLYDYPPYWENKANNIRNLKRNDVTDLVLDLKNGKSYAVEKCYNDFTGHCIDLAKELGKNFAIAVVPSSKPENVDTPIKEVARLLAAEHGLIDASNILVRVSPIDKLAYGGNRAIQVHLDSVEINPDEKHLINGKNVLLLDDVATTGNSLRACKQILKSAGAGKILCFVYAQTILNQE